MIIRKQIMMRLAERRTAPIKQQDFVKQRRKKLKIKPSVFAIYASVFLLIIAMVFTGYQSPKQEPTVANASNVDDTKIEDISVDDVLAANIAATVADAANLPIANNVANLAISTQAKSEYMQTGGINAVKPRIIGSSVAGRSITSYTVKAGDTLASIAAQFGISVDTIKWANNLQYDGLNEGTTLQILPLDGVIYEVKYDDTVDSIASKYQVDKQRLILYNDLDVSGLVPETKIILPGGILPTNERPGYVSVRYNYNPGTLGNRNEWGNCTWYAYERRLQLGIPVQSPWGNARDWAYNASLSGYHVDYRPEVGAVMVDTSGWAGHVAVVESVDSNGNIVISEMNYEGFNVVNNRSISAGQAVLYQYIH